MFDLPHAGAIDRSLFRQVNECWTTARTEAGGKITDFNPEAPLAERLEWALANGLKVAACYARFSTKMQDSTEDQVHACMKFSARHGMYLPPEFVCADEAKSGRRVRRAGLERMQAIFKSNLASVLLVFKVSRLFRQAYRGFMLFQDLVESGARAVSVTQGIDTEDRKAWKVLVKLHGMVDEMFVEATADHVREGQKKIFRKGYVTGALPVGYRPVEVENAPLTNRGLPRMKPQIDADAAQLIRQHYQWIGEGMPIREGWRRWVEADGPSDPRSTTGRISYPAYRRMLSNRAYTGRWRFCRKQNVWSSRKDGVRQVQAPPSEVEKRVCEHLRIVSDELFMMVQRRLQLEKRGRHRVRKRKKALRLFDLVTDVFWCPHCQRRFTQYGANGQNMHCPEPDCPQCGAPGREEAVQQVCLKLSELLLRDDDLIGQVLAACQTVDAGGGAELRKKIRGSRKQIESIEAKIELAYEVAGSGSKKHREETVQRIRAFQFERGQKEVELARLLNVINRPTQEASEENIRSAISRLSEMLDAATKGRLGEDNIYRAAEVFRGLVGGKVWVHSEPRSARKRAKIWGTFTPDLLQVLLDHEGIPVLQKDQDAPRQVTVWLRKLPKMDALADEVKRLFEEEHLSFRAIGDRLGCTSGCVSVAYRRWFEMRGLPDPPKPTKTGRPRKTA